VFLATLAAPDNSRGSVQTRVEIPAHQSGTKTNFRAFALVWHPPGSLTLFARGILSVSGRARCQHDGFGHVHQI
jgi:hypothetical protein